MNALNTILNRLFDAAMATFRGHGPWSAMVAMSLATTVLALLVFKHTSGQKALRAKKDRAIARLLEFALFKDDILVSFGALWRVIAANTAYLCRLLVPLAICVVPVFLVLVQLSCWLGVRPLGAGEATVLTATLRGDLPVMDQRFEIRTSPGLVVEAGPVRVPSKNEVSWRLSAAGDGDQWADISVAGSTIRKTVATGARLARCSALRPPAGTWQVLAHPSEPALPAGSPILSVRVNYPRAGLQLGHRSFNWVAVFFALTLLFGLLLMKPLRTTI